MTGTGTSADPFIISTPQDFSDIRNDVGATGDLTYYQLANDIDMSGFGTFTPIPAAYIDFNGQGFEVQNITINWGNFGAAPFIELTEGVIEKLTARDPDITGSSERVGGIVGSVGSVATVRQCSTIGGVINANSGGISRAGGVVGFTSNNSTSIVEDCYAITTINASTGTERVGGCVGEPSFSSTVRKSWAATTINLAGTNSDIGGFTGRVANASAVSDCFYNSDIYATDPSDATGKTTAQLQTIDTYTDTVNTTGLNNAYDMVDVSAYVAEIWKIEEGKYPILGFEEYIVQDPKVNVTFNSVAEPNTNVLLIQSDNKNWTNATIVSVGSTDANGDYVYTGVYDESKVFTFALNKPDSVDSTLAKGALRMATLNVI